MKLDHLKFTSFTLAFFMLPAFFSAAQPQIRHQIPVGTRPVSMGEAFVAVADDGNAIYWNPAGLARMERIQLNFAYADLYGLDLKNTYLSFFSRAYFIPALTDYLAFGVDWFRIHTLDPDPYNPNINALEFSQDQINFSVSSRPTKSLPLLKHLSLGANFKYLKLSGSTDLGLGTLETFNANLGGWGWDAGALYDLGALKYVTNGLSVGLVIHNGGDGLWGKNAADSVAIKILPQSLRWGLSYRPFSEWPGGKIPISDPVLAVDFDDRVHVGLEFWLAKTLALRAGWQKDWHTREKAALSFGVGFRKATKDFPEVRVDYALTDTPVLPNTTRQFGGSLLIKDNPRAIRIVSAQIKNVFASLYRHYARPGSGFGSVKLKNVTDQELVAGVTFSCGKYSQPQAADTVRIPGHGTIDFPLRAVFAPAILMAESGQLTGEIKVTYDYRQAQHSASEAVELTLHAKNYLTWDDPGKAAAFVTPDNPHVQELANQAFALQPEIKDERWWSRLNLYPALVLFRALQAYRINYRSDQALGPGLDKIQYPAELLVKIDRAGDCDDLSTLYASLLQYAGRQTAFVSDTSHILVMFDTGVPVTESWNLPISPRRFVQRQGTLWIPIETVMIPTSTFFAAWENAADKIDSTWRINEYVTSHVNYPAGDLQVTTPLGELPNFEIAVASDLAALEMSKAGWLRNFEQALEDTASSLPFFETAKKRNLFGVALGLNEEYLWAKTMFKKILTQDSTFAPALNNLGNVEFITGKFLEAEKLYRQALRQDPASRGTWLNLAILYEIMKGEAAPKDTARYQKQSNQALEQAAKILLGDAQNAFALLGLPEESAARGPSAFEAAPRAIPTYVMSASEPAAKKSVIRKIKNFIDGGFKKYVRTRRIEGVALDRSGAKGRNETDPNRRSLLAWSY